MNYKEFFRFFYIKILSVFLSKFYSISNKRGLRKARKQNYDSVVYAPQNGFADILEHFWLCYRYCIKHNRILYFDTINSGLMDSMDKYFVAPKNVIFGLPLDFNYSNFTEKKIHSFDYRKYYQEQILFRNLSSGGRHCIFALENMMLKKEIREFICRKIEKLGDYDAIHIRNTDYKTDYKKQFISLHKKIKNNVVVCTDSYECQQYAKIFFGNKLKIVTEVPFIGDSTLHKNANLNRYETNRDMLTDLFVLACAKKLYLTQLIKLQETQAEFSGFGRLAFYLFHRKDILRKIIYSRL